MKEIKMKNLCLLVYVCFLALSCYLLPIVVVVVVAAFIALHLFPSLGKGEVCVCVECVSSVCVCVANEFTFAHSPSRGLIKLL